MHHQAFLEFDAQKWTFASQGPYEGRLDRRKLYVLRHPWEPAAADHFGQIETAFTIPESWRPPFALHFYASDDYVADNTRLQPTDWLGMECYQGHRFKQVLIDGAVVWEVDVADNTPSYAVDITPYVKPGQPFRLALRVVDKVGTDVTLPGDFLHIGATESKKPGDPRRFFTNVWWGDVALRDQDNATELMKPRPRPVEDAISKRHKDRWPLPPLHTPWEKPIILNLETPLPLPDQGFPVSCGVPLPYGKVKDIKRIGLKDAKGRVVPVQLETLNRWNEGSLRWVRFDFLAKPDAAPYRLILNARPLPGPKFAVKVRSIGNRVRIDTGLAILEMGGDPDHLIDRVTMKDGNETVCENVTGRLAIERDGKKETYHPRWEDIRVAARGPIRAEVELRGRFVGDGESPGRFVLRLQVYPRHRPVRIFYRVFNDTAEPLKIREHSLLVPVRLKGEREDKSIYWDQGDTEASDEHLLLQEAELRQKTADTYTIRSGDKEIASGKKLTGYVGVSGSSHTVAASVRHFWQLYPKALRVTYDRIEIHLFSPTPDIPFYEPTPGEARRHELFLHFGRGAVNWDAERLNQPLHLFSADWFCASGGIGAAHPHTDPAFKPLHEFMAKTYGNVAPETFGIAFGIRHFGDRRYGDPANNYWCNNYYDAMMGFFGEYLMSGDRRWFDRGEETALHVMDIDQNHHDARNPQNVGGIHAYNSPNHTQGGYWNAMLRQGAGLATYHRLTGDPDAKEALVMLADFIVQNNFGPGSGSSRDHAGTLQTLIWAYDETRDEKYLKACRRIVEDLLTGRNIDLRRGTYVEIHGNYNYRGNVPWMDVQLAEPLYLYYRHCGDADAARLVVGLCESILCEDMTPGVPGDIYGYSHNPQFTKTSGYHVLIAPAMLYAYDLTGDPEFLACARGAFEQTLKENTVNSVVNCYWNTPALLYFLNREANR